MKCKSCKREIDELFLFCPWCGEEQLKRKKKKTEIKVPAPVQRGESWRIVLRAEGVSITEPTKEKAIAKATAIRAGFIECKKNGPKLTVGQMMDDFLAANSNTLSPSTLRNYKSARNNHYQRIIDSEVSAVDWQSAMNDEAVTVSPKTVKNLWAFVTACLNHAKQPVPDINLPAQAANDEPFLDFRQIQEFIAAVRDKPCELAALLALHSLRRSEILALTADSIDRRKKVIHVRGAVVMGEGNRLVRRDANKTLDSARDVPIMIDRVLEILPESGPLYGCHPNRMYTQINKVCAGAGLPEVGVHGLRRSFASLAYHLKWDERTTMLIGGWSNIQTVHKYYIKLSKDDVKAQTATMKNFYN